METLVFNSGGKSIAAELYKSRTPVGGAVILAYGSDGLVDNEHGSWATTMRGYAQDLADSGITAIIPDYFQRTGAKPGDLDFRRGAAAAGLMAMHRDAWERTLADAIRHVQVSKLARPESIGLLGFSLGGHLCLRLRSLAKLVVEFFAPVLDGIGSGRGSAGRVQIHHGTADPLSFDANAKVIEQELRADGVAVELCSYAGATHGFAGPTASDQTAALLSKTRTLAFLEANLSPTVAAKPTKSVHTNKVTGE